MSISTRIWLFIDYLVVSCRLPLLFSVMVCDSGCSLSLRTVLLFNILIVVFSLTSISCRQRIHRFVIKYNVRSVALGSLGSCRGLLLEHGQTFSAIVLLASWCLHEFYPCAVHTVVRLCGGAGACSDSSCSGLWVAIGVHDSATVGAGCSTRLDEGGSLLDNNWTANVVGFSLSTHRACLALLERGVAMKGLGLRLAVSELVPNCFALLEDVLVLQLEFLQWQRSIEKRHLRCRG